MIKLNISNFWHDFNYKNNFFIELFNSIYPNEIIFEDNVEKADLCIITENYVPHNINRQKTKLISFTGEPNPVNYNIADYYFTFDPTEKNNIRLPLWYIYIDFFNLTDQKNPIPTIKPEEIDNNKWSIKQKNNFCIAPFSAIHQNRISFYQTLNLYKPTYGFGIPFGNGDEEKNELKKYDIISDFKFCMAFENTYKKGYVTEKLLQAKTAGCIPLYWGDEYVTNDFNPKSFVHVNKYKSFQECLEHIKLIDNDKNLYDEYKKQPLFHYDINQSLTNIKTQIKNLLSL